MGAGGPMGMRPLLLWRRRTGGRGGGGGAAVGTSGWAPWRASWGAWRGLIFVCVLVGVVSAGGGEPDDWPRRRNLNLVRHQLSADPLYDVEWDNGTSFYFDSSACRVERFPVGVLPPWWLSGGGAEYVGREVTGGIECHVWGKAGFIVYYEEASSGRPVRWNFIDVTGIQQFVMSFEPGVALEDAQWQAPAHCFPDDGSDNDQGKSDDDVASNSKEEVGVLMLEAASRVLRKLAGAAAAS